MLLKNTGRNSLIASVWLACITAIYLSWLTRLKILAVISNLARELLWNWVIFCLQLIMDSSCGQRRWFFFSPQQRIIEGMWWMWGICGFIVSLHTNMSESDLRLRGLCSSHDWKYSIYSDIYILYKCFLKNFPRPRHQFCIYLIKKNYNILIYKVSYLFK